MKGYMFRTLLRWFGVPAGLVALLFGGYWLLGGLL